MEKTFEEEWAVLDNIYNEYEEKYFEMSSSLKIEKEIWSSSLHYNLYPLQIELSGYKPGKLYKSEPKTKKNVVVYGFDSNDLKYAGIYDGLSFMSLEYFSALKKNKVIFLGYYKKCLDRVHIIYSDINKIPQYSLLLFIDNNIKRYVKEIYEINDEKIARITAYGVRRKNEQVISIIDVIYDVTYLEDEVKEIVATQNNHKTGKRNILQIYSCK